MSGIPKNTMIFPWAIAVLAIFPLVILSNSTGQTSRELTTYTFFDDFLGDRIGPQWRTGGFGKVGLDGNGFLVVTDFDDRGVGGDWHGPWARTKVDASNDFHIKVLMDCNAETVSIVRTDMRVLDEHGMQILAFSWRDVSSSDGRSSVTMYGRDDADVLYTSKNDFEFSYFEDMEVEIVQDETSLVLMIGGERRYYGDPTGKVMAYLELTFLKYQKRCVSPDIRIDRISLTSLPLLPPEPPTSVFLSSLPDTGILIEWTTPEGPSEAPIKGYNIYFGPDGSKIELLTSVNGSTKSYSNGYLERGCKYFCQVSAVNAAGESDRSDVAETRWITAPDPPIGLQSIYVEDRTKLIWVIPEEDGGDEVRNLTIYGGADQTDLSVVATVPATVGYFDSTTVNGTVYFYCVSSTNKIDESSLSLPVSTSIRSETTPPSEPRDLKAECIDGPVVLTWDSPLNNGGAEIMGYSLRREDTSSGNISIIELTGATYRYVDEGVEIDRTYRYGISCHNGLGESEITDMIDITSSLPSTPSAPVNLSLYAINASVQIEWDWPDERQKVDMIGFIIVKGYDDDELDTTLEVGRTDSFFDANVTLGDEYFYKVSAVNSNGAGPFTNVTSVFLHLPSEEEGPGDDADAQISLSSPIVYLILAIVGIVIFFIVLLGPRKGPKKHLKDE